MTGDKKLPGTKHCWTVLIQGGRQETQPSVSPSRKVLSQPNKHSSTVAPRRTDQEFNPALKRVSSTTGDSRSLCVSFQRPKDPRQPQQAPTGFLSAILTPLLPVLHPAAG